MLGLYTTGPHLNLAIVTDLCGQFNPGRLLGESEYSVSKNEQKKYYTIYECTKEYKKYSKIRIHKWNEIKNPENNTIVAVGLHTRYVVIIRNFIESQGSDMIQSTSHSYLLAGIV